MYGERCTSQDLDCHLLPQRQRYRADMCL